MTASQPWLAAIVDTLTDAVTSTDLTARSSPGTAAPRTCTATAAAEAVGASATELLPAWADDIGAMLR